MAQSSSSGLIQIATIMRCSDFLIGVIDPQGVIIFMCLRLVPMLMIQLLCILNRLEYGLMSKCLWKARWFLVLCLIVFREVVLLIILNILEGMLEIGGIVREEVGKLLNRIWKNGMLVSLLILKRKIGKKSNYIKNLIDKFYFLELAHFLFLLFCFWLFLKFWDLVS